MVPKERFELSCPYGHYALNVARLPFRHFGISWWAVQDLNLWPLACEASAPTTELTARKHIYFSRKNPICKHGVLLPPLLGGRGIDVEIKT